MPTSPRNPARNTAPDPVHDPRHAPVQDPSSAKTAPSAERFLSDPDDDSQMILSREMLETGSLTDQLRHVSDAGCAPLWSHEQIEHSMAETMGQIPAGGDIWVFGYGSLIWNPIFPVTERRNVRIYGYHRAFCLSSTVGRGTPENPGVMLALDAGGSCVGIALKMGGADRLAELRLLWQREMLVGSYIPKWVLAHSPRGNMPVLTFVARRSHPNYIGALPDDQAVNRLMSAHGPLGPNIDYLKRTYLGLRSHGISDPVVTRLMLACENGVLPRRPADQAPPPDDTLPILAPRD